MLRVEKPPEGFDEDTLLGRYSFLTPELAGGLRPLRDPSEPDEDEID